MNAKLKYLCLLVFSYAIVFADVIELKEGTRIEGRILAENEDSLEIEIGQNDRGTIRKVLIIHSSEISSWVADQEGRVLREKGTEVNRLGGTAYVERLLQDAETKIESGNYDEGIDQFGDAADLAVKNLDGLTDVDKAKALKIKAHALRLQLAALEGKDEALDKKTDGVREEIDSSRKKLEKEIEELKDAKEDFIKEHEKSAIQLGERHKKNDLVKREEDLLKKQYLFNEYRAKVERALVEMENDQIKTKTQIKIVEERVKQAEDDAKAAERALKRR